MQKSEIKVTSTNTPSLSSLSFSPSKSTTIWLTIVSFFFFLFFTANTSQYAHYVFNTLDQDHSGLLSFEVSPSSKPQGVSSLSKLLITGFRTRETSSHPNKYRNFIECWFEIVYWLFCIEPRHLTRQTIHWNIHSTSKPHELGFHITPIFKIR